MKVKHIDLNNARDCREFLRAIRFENGTEEGGQILFLELANGDQVSLENLTDSQAIHYANQLHQELFDGKSEAPVGKLNLDSKKGLSWKKSAQHS